ncbi:MAG: GreA/GreB family elongation factor [Rhodothermales bacterium]|nr:GreA/GreB family elongation factor [Rhodothermales bacterium]MBO6779307.1 GreA/GreB family elongation factor [Rhodothermales bacterium]
MSRAFVKDDAPDGHVVIPPRPALPPGVANYVTPRGLRLLREELARLEAERGKLAAGPRDSADRSRELAVLKGRITQLEARIASARLVDPASQPAAEVRFGATVTLETQGLPRRVMTIVGVDEANPTDARISFLAPVAKRLTGKKTGDGVRMPAPGGEREFTVAEIHYAAD